MTLLVVWSWIKKWYGICFALIAAALAFVLLRHNPSELADVLRETQERHQRELDAIAKANADRDAAKRLNEQQLQAALADLQRRYNIDIAVLDTLKGDEVQRVVSLSGDEQAAELSRLFGFVVR